MISVSQIRAARALLGWSALELSRRCDVGVATIRRYEASEGLPPGNMTSVSKIKNRLEAEGIEFIGDPLVNPGVVLNVAQRG